MFVAKLGLRIPGQSFLRLGTDLALYLFVNKVSNLVFFALFCESFL